MQLNARDRAQGSGLRLPNPVWLLPSPQEDRLADTDSCDPGGLSNRPQAVPLAGIRHNLLSND
jgi:hypothetical protein